MIYRKKSDLEVSPIENCMGGQGTVKMEKLLHGPEEMLGKGRAYVRHTLNPGVSIGMHRHEGEMETMVIISGKAVHTINGEEQYLEAGDIIAAQPGDTHGIAQTGGMPPGADCPGTVCIGWADGVDVWHTRRCIGRHTLYWKIRWKRRLNHDRYGKIKSLFPLRRWRPRTR